MFEPYERLVSTRNGQFRVTSRKLTGIWETIAMVIRVLLIVACSVLIVVVSPFVPDQMKLMVTFLGLAVAVLTMLSFVSWRAVATKILGRRIPFIAGKSTQPGERITSIKLMDD